MLLSLVLLKNVSDAVHYAVGLHVLGSEAVVCNTCIALTLAYFNKDIGILHVVIPCPVITSVKPPFQTFVQGNIYTSRWNTLNFIVTET